MKKLIKSVVVAANVAAALAFLCGGQPALAVVFASTALSYAVVID